MEPDHPLTLTVEQAAQVLGVSRSTAYELVRTGDIASIRLRRRIVVPVVRLAEILGVDRDTVGRMLDRPVPTPRSTHAARSTVSTGAEEGAPAAEALTLF